MIDERSFDPIPTRPLSEGELTESHDDHRDGAAGQQLSVAIYYRDGIRIVALAEGESVVVGRSHPADVTIRDPSLSRQHASFSVIDGLLWVEDLQSMNGTWVDGERVDRHEVPLGAELNLGESTGTVQLLGSQGASSLGLTSHDGFLSEIEAEIHRARSFHRDLTLLMVRVGSDEDHGSRHLSRWFPSIRAVLKPFEKVAFYSTSTVEILLPEGSMERGRSVARSISKVDPRLICGGAVLSERDRSADALLEMARESLQRATSIDPIRITVGDSSATATIEEGIDVAGIVAQSPTMAKLMATIGRLASSSIPVLVTGETGSGKELIARALHERGPRKERPLIAVNCGAIPPQLVESTLFGHEKGAFTGAVARSKGVFESADGGTVLLDEIGELPLQAQAALLRVLETQRFARVGSTEEVSVDVRVVAATHRDLEAMCETGGFRRDLLYRLDALAVTVPPLRERREDIEPLARHFVDIAASADECDVHDISERALQLMLQHEWPGNVRELRNTIDRAVVIAQSTVIDVEDLPERLRNLSTASPRSSGDPNERFAIQEQDEINLRDEVQRFEAMLIRRALEGTSWNRKEAATRLGLPLRTLARKVQLYDIHR